MALSGEVIKADVYMHFRMRTFETYSFLIFFFAICDCHAPPPFLVFYLCALSIEGPCGTFDWQT